MAIAHAERKDHAYKVTRAGVLQHLTDSGVGLHVLSNKISVIVLA